MYEAGMAMLENAMTAKGVAKPGFVDLAQRGVLPTSPSSALSPAAYAEGLDPAADKAWSIVSAALRQELGADLFASWIAPARLVAVRTPNGGEGVAVVTHTETALGWVRRNAWRQMAALWGLNDAEHRPLTLMSRAEAAGLTHTPAARSASAAVTVLAHPGAQSDERPTTPLAAPAMASPQVGAQAEDPARTTGLQERFTFETFVPAPSNEFALSVAKKVAGWADGCFNAVLVHGPYGFGKTHLLNAIGWEALRQRPDAKVVYLTAEQFLTTFVAAVRSRDGASFKGDIRSADLLLIDDVQFIGGKKSSQEELFHSLVSLMSEGRRVVFSADRPPAALSEVDARLRSHLGSGLVCGIEAADRALRLDVLKTKLAVLADQLGVQGDARPEVLALLADRFPDSIRELEGGLNTLAVRAGDRLGSLTVEEAESILRPHLQRGGDRKVTVDEIQKAVADHYLLKQSDLLSERRTRAVARPRQLAMYLAKSLTTRSYPDIGRRFGGRDHTTVLHAVRRIEALKAEDAAIAADLEAVTRKLRG
jgi:chromosomal replication initiator protein